MRVVELVDSLEIGGAERMSVDLACGLAQAGHDVGVVCLRKSGPLRSILEQTGVEVVALQKGEGLQFGAIRQLAALLRERRVDVLHTHNPLVHHYGVLGARLGGGPIVLNTLHGPGNIQGSGRTQWIFEATCLLSDGVIACCEAVHQHLQRMTTIARRKSTVIPNGIALERFASIERPENHGDIVFGCVARLVPVKDHRSLIKAFSLVRKQRGGCRLELLGDGPLRNDLENYARELGVQEFVEFHGASLNVADFLRRIDVFALSSTSEGLPLTVLEAMASGAPVIGTAVGAIPELVQGSGCGWVAEPSCPESLATALLAALQAPDLSARGQQGRRYALAHHSLSGMIDAYERLFESAIAERRSGGRDLLRARAAVR